MSLIKWVATSSSGCWLPWRQQLVVFPILGLQASLGQNLKALVFTGVSIVRSYVLRRLF